jgi:hypothetical protein
MASALRFAHQPTVAGKRHNAGYRANCHSSCGCKCSRMSRLQLAIELKQFSVAAAVTS